MNSWNPIAAIAVTRYPCPACGGLFSVEVLARGCCAPAVAPVGLWQCTECRDLWDEHGEALECFRGHPEREPLAPISREAVQAEIARVNPRATEEDDPVEDLSQM